MILLIVFLFWSSKIPTAFSLRYSKIPTVFSLECGKIQTDLSYLGGDGIENNTIPINLQTDLSYLGGDGIENDTIPINLKTAFLYLDGIKYKRNMTKVVEILLKIKNDPMANIYLASCYENGKGGLKQNHTLAFELYLSSAEQNISLAYNNVGRCYEDGIGVEKNPDKATYWYNKDRSIFRQTREYEGKRANQFDLYIQLAGFILWMIMASISNMIETIFTLL